MSPLKVEQRKWHEQIRQDLLGKAERGDWHGVMDAAVDLRVLEAQMELTDDVVHTG